MKKTISAVVGAVALLTAVSASAGTITINPVAAPNCGSPVCLLELGNQNNQNDIDDFLIGEGYVLDLVYKADPKDGESDEEAKDWYTTTFSNTATDPSDATIVWDGPGLILPTYLLVKDGKQTPAFYFYDISSWNGKDTIELKGFWPDKGAISHISFYGAVDEDGDNEQPVPEPSSAAAAIFGLGALGLAGRFIRK